MIPPWQPVYLTATAEAARDIVRTLATLGGKRLSIAPSMGKPENLALVARISNGPLSTVGYLDAGGARVAIADAIASIQRKATAILLPASIVVWIGLLGAAAAMRRWHPGHIVVAALVVAIGMRVGLLALLEATSIPSNNMLYLSPAVPMALVLGPCAAFLLLAYLRNYHLRRAPPSGASGRSAT